MTTKEHSGLSGQVIGAAMKVHSVLGPGLLEGTYEACLSYELRKRGHCVLNQLPLPVIYDGVQMELGYRLDLLIDDTMIIEVKAVTKMLPVHEAQILSYLRLSGYKLGLLINFHVPHLKDGIKRMVNQI